MTFLPALTSPLFWVLLGAVPLGIVLLYFLKLRREPVQVPSTYLWQKTIEDLHVNSLLQRMRRSLLLLLQLLVVACAVLALLRPGVQGSVSGQGRSIFLLDCSASMNATDGPDGTTRFAIAVQQIAQQIQQMSDTDTAMLVTFSDRAEVLQSFTSDRRRLREALLRATPTQRRTDILGALRAAEGLANPRRSSEVGDLQDVQVADAMPADLKLFSDGGFPDVKEFDLGNLRPVYQAIGTPAPSNLAVIALSAQRNVDTPDKIEAFATIANTGAQPAQTSLSLLIEDQLVDAQTVEVPAGGQTGVTFVLTDDQAVGLKLVIDRQDDLPIDNVAYAGLTPIKIVSVLLVSPGNQPLELGMKTPAAARMCRVTTVDPTFLQTEDYRNRMAAGVDDLVIYDRCSPDAMPPTNTFFIGSLPPQGWTAPDTQGPVVLVDVDRGHPLMRFVDLYSLLIFAGRGVTGPEGTSDLVSGDGGSILALADRDGYQDLVLGFEVVSIGQDGRTQANTNWYAERSWPVFVLNVLRHLAGAADATAAASYPPGETVRLRLERVVDRVELDRGPQSPPVPLTVSPQGIVEVVQTDSPGLYRVSDEDRVVDLFTVNLFDLRESQIAVKPTVELGYESIESTSVPIQQRNEWWRYLLIAMLGMLAAEWWYYCRRVA